LHTILAQDLSDNSFPEEENYSNSKMASRYEVH